MAKRESSDQKRRRKKAARASKRAKNTGPGREPPFRPAGPVLDASMPPAEVVRMLQTDQTGHNPMANQIVRWRDWQLIYSYGSFAERDLHQLSATACDTGVLYEDLEMLHDELALPTEPAAFMERPSWSPEAQISVGDRLTWRWFSANVD
jgi:hypothetical protein